MNKEVLVLQCHKCGEEFLYEYRGSGAKAKYCEKCRELVRAEQVKMFNDRRKEKAQDTTEVAKTDNARGQFVDKIAELLTQLDTTRVELCELAKQMGEYQSGYDKNDQTYLHQLENLDVDDIETTTAFIKEWKSARNSRRNVKDLLAVVGKTIDAIPYKNYANALPILKGSSYYTR